MKHEHHADRWHRQTAAGDHQGVAGIGGEKRVAAADIIKLASYRGEPFAWAWLANEGHPAYMGHIIMAEMIALLLTERQILYPE